MTGKVILIATFLAVFSQAVIGDANKPIPDQATKFQSSVEINQPGAGYSVGVKEYYDSENNRSAVIVTQMGTTQMILHNHKIHEILNVKEKVVNKKTAYDCTVLKRDTDVEISDFYNPTWLLREATKTKETYVPQAKPIRGIPVEHWTAVVKPNLTVDYYYSEQAWDNSFQLHQIPVRVKISGLYNIVYDYFDFLNDVPDESVFQTPVGAYCPNRTSTKQVPVILDQVSYRVEYSSPETDYIFSMDIWADTQNKFVRIDYGKQLDSLRNQLLTEIHDFNLDMNYKIDRVSGQCQLLELSNSDELNIDMEKGKTSSGDTAIHMKHPYEMFNLKHNFQYTGQRTFSGILCDTFIAQVMNYQVSGVPFNVTMEYYFTADDWREISNKEFETEINVPVFLQIKSLDMSFIQNYRFEDFDTGSMYLSQFDVTKCFTDDDKLDFQVDFTLPDHIPWDARDEILEKSHLIIAHASSITPLRIQKAKLQFDRSYMHFVATLVGLPPAYTQFKLDYSCSQLSKNQKVVENIHSAQDCADECEDEPSFQCNSFGYCPAKRLCSLSGTKTDSGQPVPGTRCCKHFSRVYNLAHKWVSTPKAWDNLKDAVYQGNEIVKFGELELVAVGVKNDVLNGPNREISSTTWKNMFTRLRHHMIQGHDSLVLPGVGVDDCAAACADDENFYCFSFDFCYTNGECRLSSVSTAMNPQYLKWTSGCDVYNRNFETYFNKFPGETILPRMDVAYQRVGTPEQCASLCFHFGEFACKSFDYCELIQTCVIGHKHILEVPESEINIEPMCNHYSVKYLADFKKTSKYMMKLADDEIVSDISEEQCAKNCVENNDFVCKSFDYCSDSKLCMYRSAHYKEIKAGNGLQPSAFCSHYSRQHPPHALNSKPPKTGYSSGSMGALGFFMLIIGICGGVMAKFMYNRHIKKRRDSLSAQMMKDDAIY